MTATPAKLPLDRPVADFLSTRAITLPVHFTVDQSLHFLRSNPSDASIIYFYVVDPAENDKRLGVLPARRLLLSLGTTPIRSVMTTTLITTRNTDTLLDAMELFAMHRLLALPVVDARGKFLGILDYSLYTEEVFDLAENRQLAEVFQLIGVRLEQARYSSPLRGYRLRMPWLLTNIAGGITCAILGSLFEGTLAKYVIFSVFIPLILTLAESVSVQSMTLAIAVAGTKSTPAQRRRSIIREASTAILLGLTSGALVGSAALLWRQPLAIPLTIASAITTIMFLASLLGRIVPSAIHKLRLDPSVASGPVTLAVVDVMTIAIYLTAASLLT